MIINFKEPHYIIMLDGEGGILEGWLPDLTSKQTFKAFYIEDSDGRIMKCRTSERKEATATEQDREEARKAAKESYEPTTS